MFPVPFFVTFWTAPPYYVNAFCTYNVNKLVRQDERLKPALKSFFEKKTLYHNDNKLHCFINERNKFLNFL